MDISTEPLDIFTDSKFYDCFYKNINFRTLITVFLSQYELSPGWDLQVGDFLHTLITFSGGYFYSRLKQGAVKDRKIDTKTLCEILRGALMQTFDFFESRVNVTRSDIMAPDFNISYMEWSDGFIKTTHGFVLPPGPFFEEALDFTSFCYGYIKYGDKHVGEYCTNVSKY